MGPRQARRTSVRQCFAANCSQSNNKNHVQSREGYRGEGKKARVERLLPADLHGTPAFMVDVSLQALLTGLEGRVRMKVLGFNNRQAEWVSVQVF